VKPSSGLAVCFLEAEETCPGIFGMLLRFVENLLESETLVCPATCGGENCIMGILQLWFNCFSASFFKALGIPMSMGVGRRGRGALSPLVLKISEKKFVFLVSSGKKQISPLLTPLWKTFGKIPW